MDRTVSRVTVADVVNAIARRFPVQRAAEWDRVGLLAGDPDEEVAGIAVGLDPTLEAVAFAAESGANVLLTHHPAFLTPPESLRPGRGAGGILFAALDAGIALVNAHTNLDRDHEAQGLLPAALGLEPVSPVERSPMAMTLVTVYAPSAASEAVIEAMSATGAGRIGDYERCSFSSEGEGSFLPGATSAPCVGAPGRQTAVPETRIEMLCPPNAAVRVIAAAVRAHPYEEPLVTANSVMIARNAACIGMLCGAPYGMTLRGLATVSNATFGITPRVWGDPDTVLERIVTSTGSAGSLVGDALAAGAQALVAGEVRYHDALDATEAGLSIIELGHDVSEWPLVSLLERTVLEIAGVEPSMVSVLPARPGWWTT